MLENVIQMKSEHLIHMKAKFECLKSEMKIAKAKSEHLRSKKQKAKSEHLKFKLKITKVKSERLIQMKRAKAKFERLFERDSSECLNMEKMALNA